MVEVFQRVDLNDIKLLDEHYNAAIAYKKANCRSQSVSEWYSFKQIVDKYVEVGCWLFKTESFETYMTSIADCLKPAVRKDWVLLKSYYDDAIDLEKKRLFEEAESQWEAFNKTLKAYWNATA